MTVNALSGDVWVLSIHDRTGHGRIADVPDILGALEHWVDEYTWVIDRLDCSGESMAEVCSMIEEKSELEPVSMPGASLRELTRPIVQTVDAKFIAMPHTSVVTLEEVTNLRNQDSFRGSRAQAVIWVSDGTLFVVMTKVEGHVRAIKARFTDVRVENPELFW